MSNPTFYARIQNKYDTKANLDDSTFIPKSGELIGASGAGSGSKYKKLKIGDGTNKYSNLQFVDQEAIDLANAAQDTADEALEKAEGAQGAATNAANNSYVNASISGKTITLTKGDGTTKTLTTQDTVYTLSAATSSTLGGVKVGSNITNSSGTISLSKSNVTSALGYTPPETNTTYSVVSTTADGLAPKRDGSTTKFLRADGTWAVPPDTNTTYSSATTSVAGLMSASDKSKLDGIATGANKITVDSALSSSSTNPVQNKVINSALAGKLSTTGTAAKATADANGNNIVNTYATKTSVESCISTNSGALNINTQYDGKLSMIQSGSNLPSGSQYGVVLTMPYRKMSGNTTPDFGAQIFIPNGDDNTSPNSMFYRTSLKDTWNSWQEVMPKSGGTFTGNVVAYSTNRTTSSLRNSEVRTTSATGTLQSTNKIIYVRK